ncbi:hypothetical protein [Larsenimonas rhizosphaerae]|uniref:Uncharacterized protein n=1 Tax=Larsenimonas rhizosphaerae TaxID=2944682 RepID=A0AA41ZMB4_9GAMM|nr:hypothetical protein [Larsenimonas rhizosphaerae]MCM2130796.1 hypothetical protein [Larsenimonas rhizosphaerae]MCX2523500.1 hypothetical protein [Larsenimonas rhizosphaerae]
MTQPLDVETFIQARKRTRMISDLLKARASDHLSTLAPLVRPQPLFGEYLQGAPRGSGRESQHHFKEFRSLFDKHAGAAPFNLMNELDIPLNIISSTPALFALEYDIDLTAEERIRVISPVRWVVGYSSFELSRFRKVINDPNRSSSELQRFVVHYLMLFHCFSKADGLGRLLRDLRFPISFQRLKGFGDLPFCIMGSPINATLPGEDIIRQSTDISGTHSFEELIDDTAIDIMQDDLREQLLTAVHDMPVRT